MVSSDIEGMRLKISISSEPAREASAENTMSTAAFKDRNLLAVIGDEVRTRIGCFLSVPRLSWLLGLYHWSPPRGYRPY